MQKLMPHFQKKVQVVFPSGATHPLASLPQQRQILGAFIRHHRKTFQQMRELIVLDAVAFCNDMIVGCAQLIAGFRGQRHVVTREIKQRR